MISERLALANKLNEDQQEFFKGIKPNPILQESLKKPKLLVVDDEPHVLKLLNFTLRNHFDVIEANGANEAIYKARLEQPQIILSDLLMPTMNGDDLCKELQKFRETKHIPFLFLTALSHMDNKLKSLKTEAIDYITKPFDSQLLIKKLQSSLLY